MSYSIDFANNIRYGADDINIVRSMIMTAGVLQKDDTRCKVSLAEGVITVAPGEALFYDGCRIEITEAETLSYDGEDCYIYLDRCYTSAPKVTTGKTLPSDAVPLAKISGGVVTDIREYSSLKIPSMADNTAISRDIDMDFSLPNDISKTVTIEFDDVTDIKYMLFKNKFDRFTTRVFFNFEKNYAFGLNHTTVVKGSAQEKLYLYETNGYIKATKNGNKITFDVGCVARYNMNVGTVIVL